MHLFPASELRHWCTILRDQIIFTGGSGSLQETHYEKYPHRAAKPKVLVMHAPKLMKLGAPRYRLELSTRYMQPALKWLTFR